jgi:hypothetical protein
MSGAFQNLHWQCCYTNQQINKQSIMKNVCTKPAETITRTARIQNTQFNQNHIYQRKYSVTETPYNP